MSQSGVHSGGRVQIRIASGHDGCHGRTRGKASHVDALSLESIFGYDLARETSEQRGLASAAVLMRWLEPIPVSHWIGSDRLFRIHDQQCVLFGELIHASAGSEVVCRLRAAVQH